MIVAPPETRVGYNQGADAPHLSPFVKWAGGKTRVLQRLLYHVPEESSHYYEPFLGGGALFFALSRQTTRFSAFLSDTNRELVNAYQVIRDDPESLIDHLSKIQREYDATSDKSGYYYQQRQSTPSNRQDSASRLIFLNKTCYNGLYRVNAKGKFNVPFGRYKNPKLFDKDNIRAISRALLETRAKLEAIDYKSAVQDCGRSDFVYFDPPYQAVSRTSSFTSYTPGGFSRKDHSKLADVFKALSKKGCNLLLSNSNTRLVRKLYGGFSQELVRVNRSINSVGSKRKGFTELIVYNTPTTSIG